MNLNAHIKSIVQNFNTPVAVALNKFYEDMDSELFHAREKSIEAGSIDRQLADDSTLGGSRAIDLKQSKSKEYDKGLFETEELIE